MNKLYSLLLPVFIIVAFTGCKKSYSDLYTNNNQPISVQPSLLFNGVLNSMADFPASGGTTGSSTGG